MISFDDFSKIELLVGTVLEAEEVENSEKLIKLKVDLGLLDVVPSNEGTQLEKPSSESASCNLRLLDPRLPARNASRIDAGGRGDDSNKKRDIRQVLAGVKQWYKPEDFVGKQVVIVANLEPRTMMGLESQGMMLAADSEDGPVFLTIPKQVPTGTKIR